jgi:alanine racemase
MSCSRGETVVDLDLSAFADNVSNLLRRIGSEPRLFVSVKADGYGMGACAVALRAQAAGAHGVSLADRAQAVALRQAGFRGDILVYACGPIDAAAAHDAISADLILTVLSADEARTLSALAVSTVRVAIKVEVGTERLGVLPAELADLVKRVDALPRLRLAVINAHPSFPESAPDVVLELQHERFRQALAHAVPGRPELLAPFASSKVLRRTGAMCGNALDPGQMLYESTSGKALVRRMWTRLIQARPVTRDFAVEHATFPLSGVERVGVIAYGRVDGAGRCDSGWARIRGQCVPFLGPPALEYCRIDLTRVPSASAGDEVELIGGPDDGPVSLRSVFAERGIVRETDFMIAVPARVSRRVVA